MRWEFWRLILDEASFPRVDASGSRLRGWKSRLSVGRVGKSVLTSRIMTHKPSPGGNKKKSCDGGGLNQAKDEMKNRCTSWLETRPGGGEKERAGVESAGWMCLSSSSSRLGAEMDFGQSAESEVSPMAAACVAAQHAPVLLTFRWWRSAQLNYMLH